MFRVLSPPFFESLKVPQGHNVLLVWYHKKGAEIVMSGTSHSSENKEELVELFEKIKVQLEKLPSERAVRTFLNGLAVSLEQGNKEIDCVRLQ